MVLVLVLVLELALSLPLGDDHRQLNATSEKPARSIQVALPHIICQFIHHQSNQNQYSINQILKLAPNYSKSKIHPSNIMSSSPSTFSSSNPDHHHHHHHHLSATVSEQLCYVHCNICETVLAVSVPCTSLSKTVTVRCGHCSTLLSVNMQGLLLPSPPPPAPSAAAGGHGFFSPNVMEQMNGKEKYMMNPCGGTLSTHNFNIPTQSAGFDHLPKEPVVNKPPEKRQRIPSAYNRFIKEEIQRIKSVNPDISHREAFSAAAKNWAHFPHIQFGLMHDHLTTKKASVLQQEGEEIHELMKIGLLSTTPNLGVSPC